jgi:hypothetical protein
MAVTVLRWRAACWAATAASAPPGCSICPFVLGSEAEYEDQVVVTVTTPNARLPTPWSGKGSTVLRTRVTCDYMSLEMTCERTSSRRPRSSDGTKAVLSVRRRISVCLLGAPHGDGKRHHAGGDLAACLQSLGRRPTARPAWRQHAQQRTSAAVCLSVSLSVCRLVRQHAQQAARGGTGFPAV